jgi:hypothetical protein
VHRAMAAAILAALLTGGCSTARSHWNGPFTYPHPYHISSFIRGMVVVGGIYDIMVPDFHNYSGSSVRVVSVRLVSPHGPGIRILGAWAYPYSRLTHHGTAVIDEGNLTKDCPESFAQHPVADVVVAPRSNTNWYVVIALVFLRPGQTYHLGVARVDYVTGGQSGWQYYRLPNAWLHTFPKGAIPNLYQPEVCGKNARKSRPPS